MKQMLEWTKTLIKPHTFAFFNDTFHWWIHRHVHVYDQITWKIKENRFSIIKSIYLKYPYTGVSKSLQSCLTLCDPMDHGPPGFSVHRILDRNTGVSCHFLLQGIFPTQGSNLHLLHLLHWRAGSLQLVPPGKCYTGMFIIS